MHQVSDCVFDMLNFEINGNWAGALAFTGCIDAIDSMPAGSMTNANGIRSQTYASREYSLAEQLDFEALINSII